MSLILSGSDGLSDVDGSAATPAIRGTDSNTGMFFPAADTIAFAEGGTEVMRIDSAGNVGIGTSSPAYRLQVGGQTGLTGAAIDLFRTGGLSSNIGGVLNFRPGLGQTASDIFNLSICAYDHSGDANADGLSINASDGISFCTGSNSRQERARIDSSGYLLINRTTNSTSSYVQIYGAQPALSCESTSTGGVNQVLFRNPNGTVGSIGTSATSTSYNTSSDYRLKKNIAPMTGALARVAALKPVTYKWKVDGSGGEGFIAHELQAVVPDCVTGEKDAVDAEGNPVYQGIDTSFLSATLAAAIQELHQIVQAQAAEIAELKANLP
jgi:hypothetical protein